MILRIFYIIKDLIEEIGNLDRKIYVLENSPKDFYISIRSDATPPISGYEISILLKCYKDIKERKTKELYERWPSYTEYKFADVEEIVNSINDLEEKINTIKTSDYIRLFCDFGTGKFLFDNKYLDLLKDAFEAEQAELIKKLSSY
ncbi:MAG: hypothetical protein K0Q47_49 [Sedimentibacter sp.]|jgi:hypothetical protein|nr:hypothetical protein [Sedimentibacter sp.]